MYKKQCAMDSLTRLPNRSVAAAWVATALIAQVVMPERLPDFDRKNRGARALRILLL